MAARLRSLLPDGVELRYSRTGVPRIKSSSTTDAFRALGVLHGWDRGMQITLSRFAARGQLCEHLGYQPGLLRVDRLARSLNFGRSQTGGFPAGANGELTAAYLEGLESVRMSGRRSALFRLLGIHHPSWDVQEMGALVRFISYTLAYSQGHQEMGILKCIASGPEYLSAWASLLPGAFETFNPHDLAGLILNDYPYTVLDQTSASRSPIREPSGGAPAASNNWAISGRRTASGKVIVCNDPHLAVNRLPGFWYQAEITTPDLYLMGFSVPGTPAFIGGWNRHLSWGITHAATDSEDLILEQCRDGRIERSDGLREPEYRQESIAVKRATDDVIGVYELDGGLLYGDPHNSGRYLRRKWPGLCSPVLGTLDALMDLSFSTDVAGAMDAARMARAIDLNWVFGDKDGHIAYQMSGSTIAHASEFDGVLPRPGWAPEFTEPEACPVTLLPRLVDPEEGFIVSANQRIEVNEFPVHQSLPFSSDRADRIRDLITATTNSNRVDMQRIQYDLHSLQARRVLAFCRPYLPPAAAKLVDWDCSFEVDSREATLYDEFARQLLRSVLGGRLVPSKRVDQLLEDSLLETVSHRLFENAYRDAEGPFATVCWSDLIPAVFHKAEATVTGGARSRPRRWGARNRILFRHPILGWSILRRFVNSGPFDYPGYGTTPFQGRTIRHNRGNEHTTGPTYHLIVDFGENAAYTNAATGRTERPLQTHYRLGLTSWLTARYERFAPPSEEYFDGG